MCRHGRHLGMRDVHEDRCSAAPRCIVGTPLTGEWEHSRPSDGRVAAGDPDLGGGPWRVLCVCVQRKRIGPPCRASDLPPPSPHREPETPTPYGLGRLRFGRRLWPPRGARRPLDFYALRRWQLQLGRLWHKTTAELVLIQLFSSMIERSLDVSALRLAHVAEGLHLRLALAFGRHGRLDVAGPLEPKHLVVPIRMSAQRCGHG